MWEYFLYIVETKKERKCELCYIDISDKKSNARYCSRYHKEKHYRHLNRDKYRVWKSEEQKRNKDRLNKQRRVKSEKEKKELGFSKSYIRTYTLRHIQELIDLKGKRCYKCGIKQFLGIHHTKYTKDPNDWEFVCQLCHINIHEPTTLLQNTHKI